MKSNDGVSRKDRVLFNLFTSNTKPGKGHPTGWSFFLGLLEMAGVDTYINPKSYAYSAKKAEPIESGAAFCKY